MTVEWRLANVESLKVINMFHAAVVQVGDNGTSDLWDYAIALQRAIPDFAGDETRFASYPIFFLPIPVWPPVPSDCMSASGPGSEIRVGRVKVVTHTASSLIRIGSAGPLRAESRIKHIRQFNDPSRGDREHALPIVYPLGMPQAGQYFADASIAAPQPGQPEACSASSRPSSDRAASAGPAAGSAAKSGSGNLRPQDGQ